MNKFCLLFFSFILIQTFNFAQVSSKIASVNAGYAKEKEELIITADLYQSEGITRILVSYRVFGQGDYKLREMNITGNKAIVKIPAEDIIPPYLEYYIIVETESGSEYYPPGAPLQSNPLQVNIISADKKVNDIGVLILSPEPGEKINAEQFFISISMVDAPSIINNRGTKIFIGNADITPNLVFTENLIVYSPDDEMKKSLFGDRTIKIELYDSTGAIYKSTAFPVTFGKFKDEIFAETKEFRYNFNFQGESRNESFNNVSTTYNRGTLNFNSTYDDWKLSGNAYVTSEEKSYLQPQHRFSMLIENDWLHLGLGDNYPRFPSLILDGKRVRGINGSVTFGFANIQAAYGQVTRNIEGDLLQLYSNNNAPFGSNIIDYNDSMKAMVNPGTYSRNLLAVRPYFGRGESFQLGFSYLHSSDDKSSVRFSARPKENVVIGTDLLLAFDNKRIQFTTQAAISLINEDISTGTFSDAIIDSLFGDGKAFGGNPETIKKIKRYASGIITVNQFLKPLNIDQFSTLATETAFSLNYFNNFLKVGYVFRGNDFQSFGQSFVRTDVKGFNILDRIRLLNNRLYLTFGYEDLSDNLQKTKFATTVFRNMNTSVSYYPLIDIPYFTIGYSRYSSKNDLTITDPDSTKRLLAVDDITNRYSVQFGYDFEYEIKHQSSVSFVYSKRDDMSLYNYNSKNLSMIMMLISTWKLPLLTTFSLSINSSSSPYQTFNYTSVSAGAKYHLLEGQLELSALINPNFGDYKRIIFNAYGKYFILKNLSVMLDLKYFKNSSPLPGDSIVSLMTRYEI